MDWRVTGAAERGGRAVVSAEVIRTLEMRLLTLGLLRFPLLFSTRGRGVLSLAVKLSSDSESELLVQSSSRAPEGNGRRFARCTDALTAATRRWLKHMSTGAYTYEPQPLLPPPAATENAKMSFPVSVIPLCGAARRSRERYFFAWQSKSVRQPRHQSQHSVRFTAADMGAHSLMFFGEGNSVEECELLLRVENELFGSVKYAQMLRLFAGEQRKLVFYLAVDVQSQSVQLCDCYTVAAPGVENDNTWARRVEVLRFVQEAIDPATLSVQLGAVARDNAELQLHRACHARLKCEIECRSLRVQAAGLPAECFATTTP